jgi:hypothetical protein
MEASAKQIYSSSSAINTDNCGSFSAMPGFLGGRQAKASKRRANAVSGQVA